MTLDEEGLRALAARVADSPKYRDVHPDTVLRVTRAAVRGARREADAVQSAREMLHRIVGAFRSGEELRRLRQNLADPWPPADDADFQARCHLAMRSHASTRERLAILPGWAELLRGVLGPGPGLLADLACGMNAFALPSLGLPAGWRYAGSDTDGAVVALGRAMLAHLRGDHAVHWADLFTADLPDRDQADVVLLLKSLPTLEAQEPGAVESLLRDHRARVVILSFPTASLCGVGGKSMGRNYSDQARALADRLGRGCRLETLGNELFALLDRV